MYKPYYVMIGRDEHWKLIYVKEDETTNTNPHRFIEFRTTNLLHDR